MGNLSKAKVIPLEDLYDLDMTKPDDRLEYAKIKLFQQINAFMAKNSINKSELAKKMGKTRQEITNRFSGHSLTIEFLMKAACALGLEIDIQPYMPVKTKTVALFEKIVSKAMAEDFNGYISANKPKLADTEVKEMTRYRKNLLAALKKPFYTGV